METRHVVRASERLNLQKTGLGVQPSRSVLSLKGSTGQAGQSIGLRKICGKSLGARFCPINSPAR